MQVKHKRSRVQEVNSAVREQAAKVSEMHARLYAWASRLRKLIAVQTKIDVPEVALAIERGRRERMGWYHVGRDGLQLQGRVTINSLYLGLAECWVLEIVAHEILHFAEEIAGRSSKATRSSWHCLWFRQHAQALGFPCDEKGRGTISSIKERSPFGELLVGHGVSLVPLIDGGGRDTGSAGGLSGALLKLPPPRGTMVRWSCGCTNIRAATVVTARCLRCGRPFERADRRAAESPSLSLEGKVGHSSRR